MHDKAVRRRRAVLAVLVACSLILLTAYYGESENSPLHSIQQGIVETFTPIQEGASKLLSPVRDLAGWVSSTLHAKSQNGQLRSLNATLGAKAASDSGAVARYEHIESSLKMHSQLSLSGDGPVSAGVIGYDPEVWYETIKLDRGAGSGLRVGDPVLSSAGLVGDISSVGSNYAEVASLSNPKFAVEARIVDPAGHGDVGILQPSVGNPTTLQDSYVPASASVSQGDEVVTAGYGDPSNPSISGAYPAGIPIGVISNFDYNQLANDNSVDVSPFVDLRNVNRVTVLTRESQ